MNRQNGEINMTEYEYDMLTKDVEMKQMKNIDVARSSEITYLGPEDAATEWADPNIAMPLFVHTKAYTDFINPHTLVLLGRTGTGKTAILQCVKNDVKEGRLSQYTFVATLSFDDIIDNLTQFNDIDNSPKCRIDTQKSIMYILNVTVMKHLILNYKKGDMLREVKKYLENHGLLEQGSTGSIIKKILQSLSGVSNKVGEIATLLEQINDIGNILFTSDYTSALDELHIFLKNGNLLLLIDSSNEYNINDNRTVIALKALINDCFDFYSNRSEWNIDVKLALPSEIYTHILQHLPSKQRGNTVVILWKYGDLTSLIAKRFFFYMGKPQYRNLFCFLKKYSYESLSDVNCCAALLSEFLPKMCETSLEFNFDTIAFCIRHTLKKPRELKTIFNALIDKIIETNNVNFFHQNPGLIKDVIHSTQERMIGSALSMYDNSYPNIESACSIVLKNQNYLFRGDDLVDSVRKAAANTSKLGYGAEEIKRVLLESGLIGVVNSIEVIPANSPLHNEREISLVMARFEYQIKGLLLFDKDEYYVVHPMCYEHLTCKVNKYVLVYVDKNSDSQDIINSIVTRDPS